MPLSDSQVRALVAGETRQSKSVGGALILVIEPLNKGGGKSFEGRMRFPPGRQGKQVPVRIGPYGKGVGHWSLKEARDEWERIRAWSKQSGLDPRELKRQEQQPAVQQHTGPTLEQAAEAFLEHSTAREVTKKGYRNMLWNQVLPVLGADTPVAKFSWDCNQKDGRNGRQVILDLKAAIERRAPVHADRVLMVLRQIFNYAIDQGWIKRDQNPALCSRGVKSRHISIPHASLSWEQLPKFFEDLKGNEAKGSVITIAAVKLVFMSFLRVSSVAGMRWVEIDEKQNLWRVPADRMKNGKEHLVPLTDPMNDLFDSIRKLELSKDFVLPSPRGWKGHLNPSSINQHLVKMGYKNILRAHGIRSIPMTAGQEVLGFSSELIQRQLAHAIGDKVRQAYDRSEFIEERKKFMVAWCDALLQQGMVI